jgi:casein kinase II subunit beta
MDFTEDEAALAVESMQQYENGSDSNMDFDTLSDENVSPSGWIQWFCSREGHDFLVEIEEEYIRDQFHLYGLKKRFKTDRYSTCIKMILSNYSPTEEDLQNEEFLELNQEASDLYGLIHSRFIITQRGLSKLYNKFLNGTYGYCPRALCDRQKVLPVGLSDELRTSRVKVFCPKCEEVYIPKFKSINVDGAYFGTSVPHIFLKTFKEAVVLPPRIFNYEPKIHGFKLYKKTGSRAAGAKDVIHYPKAFSSKEAADELKSRPAREMERKRVADEEAAKQPEDNGNTQEQNKGGQGGKKNKKKNKKKH